MLSFKSRRCTCVRHQDVDHTYKSVIKMFEVLLSSELR